MAPKGAPRRSRDLSVRAGARRKPRATERRTARKATGLHARTRSAPKARRRSATAEALTERKILSALDLITGPEPRMAAVAETVRTAAERVRDAFASPNVVGVGIAEKVSAGRRTGALALTFYVEKKIDLESLSPKRCPPHSPFPVGRPRASWSTWWRSGGSGWRPRRGSGVIRSSPVTASDT